MTVHFLQTVTRGADVRSLRYAASGQVANDNRGPTAVYFAHADRHMLSVPNLRIHTQTLIDSII